MDIGLLALSKGLVYRILTQYRKKGFNFRNVLIVGSRERAKDVIDAIGDYLGSGYRVLGCLELDHGDFRKELKNGIQVIGTINHLEKILWEKVVDELVFAMPLKKIAKVDRYVSFAEQMGVSVRIIPDWQIQKLRYKPGIASIQFEEFMNIPTLALTTTPPNKGELLIKSIFDYLFAGTSLLVLLPVFLVINWAIKVASKGPVFFKQERCGLKGISGITS